jgi:hypothetical protein
MKIVAYFTLLVVLTYAVLVALAPVEKLKEIEKQSVSDNSSIADALQELNHVNYHSVIRKQAFLDACLAQSVEDSIALSINLCDSTLNISIKGVNIHHSTISNFEIDQMFTKLSNLSYKRLFSSPIAIHQQYATIVKEPVVVREAPNNPAEAEVNAWQPDTLVQNPAFVQLYLDHDFQILLKQDQNNNLHQKKAHFKFNTTINFESAKNSIIAFLSFKKQTYKPTITIYLPVDELRSVYRALPKHTSVSLCL